MEGAGLTSATSLAPLANAAAMARMVAGSSRATKPLGRATSVCRATSWGGCVRSGAVRAAMLAPAGRRHGHATTNDTSQLSALTYCLRSAPQVKQSENLGKTHVLAQLQIQATQSWCPTWLLSCALSRQLHNLLREKDLDIYGSHWKRQPSESSEVPDVYTYPEEVHLIRIHCCGSSGYGAGALQEVERFIHSSS